jgi:hypothetical protein
MSSYLEAYGSSEEQRAKRIRLIKISALALFCALVLGAVLYGIFKNHGEERQAQAFVAALRSQDYQAAYRMWGCTDAHPCADYPLDKFMGDWGPKSPHADQSSAHIGVSQSCGSGVVIRLDYQGAVEPVPLWVERGSKVISFAPWPECPGRHLHIGAWLRSVFK